MRVDILTLFPGIFEGPLRESLLGRAIEAGLVRVGVHDIRDHTEDPHRQVDDYGFGGGPGMVIKPEPVFDAVESLGVGENRVIVLSPAGRPLTIATRAGPCDSPAVRKRSIIPMYWSASRHRSRFGGGPAS
jgi:tRNA (guanine37-N1)-methyltransferase